LIDKNTKYALMVANPRAPDRPAGGRPPEGRIVMTPNYYPSSVPLILELTHKKRITFGLLLRNFLCMKSKKIGKIWKELDLTKRMRPAGTFLDYPFRSYSSLKMTSKNEM
jgi:hypothetical protein